MSDNHERGAAPGPLRVALTGGIATGKSYCLKRFAEAGAPTIDADVLAHQAVAPGTTGFNAVRSRFGATVVTGSGELDRKALGRLVFKDATARLALEAIVHPTVYAAIERWLGSLPRAHRAAIVEIPLLFETGRDQEFDVVVVAACTRAQQVDRLVSRAGLSPAEAEQRVAVQMPIEEKAARGDYVIDTSGTREHTDAQVLAIWHELERRATCS